MTMKYAIIESGGKQYKAVEGTTIEVDKLPLEVGQELKIDQVLLVVNEDDVSVGTPIVEGSVVKITVVAQVKARKIVIYKYRARKRHRVKTGHRQQYTRLKIDSIGME
ncbi:MAG: 50S ribosomal protein L21 [Anaerolineaceae bacterium]|nr:50S ribosomal protein L21 [Anaerolineaceae bacterium]